MADPTWKDGLVLKVVNIATYILFLSSNLYAALGPHHEYSTGGRETYLTPAQWAFSVWPLIHFLLLGYVIFQFFPSGYAATIDGVGWRFPILGVLNSIYSNLYMRHGRGYQIAAWVDMLFVAATVSTIYQTLKVRYPPKNINDSLWVHLPFSLYHGFSIVLVFVSGMAAFGAEKVVTIIVDAVKHHHHEGHQHVTTNAGIATKVIVFLALFFLEGTAAGYALYGQGDVAGAAVIAWSLLAIFYEQTESRFIHWSALAFFILSLLAVVRALFSAVRSHRDGGLLNNDPERAPLVG